MSYHPMLFFIFIFLLLLILNIANKDKKKTLLVEVGHNFVYLPQIYKSVL